MVNRPSWDEYFLYLAFAIALRSDDRFIKHGAVIVDNKTKHIIGTGYNNTIAGFPENLIDLNDRDERRPYMIHAEENAILNSSTNASSLSNGATLYCTGLPCVNCLQRIMAFGITDIVYVKSRLATVTENSDTAVIRANIHETTFDITTAYGDDNYWVKKGLELHNPAKTLVKQEEAPYTTTVTLHYPDGTSKVVGFEIPEPKYEYIKPARPGVAPTLRTVFTPKLDSANWHKAYVDDNHDVIVFGNEGYEMVKKLIKDGQFRVVHKGA